MQDFHIKSDPCTLSPGGDVSKSADILGVFDLTVDYSGDVGLLKIV